MYIIIAAIGKNNELGKDNKLLWSLPGDLKFFKNTTLNSNIIMGKNTFESLPGILPKRKHIVLTHSGLNIENENLVVYNDLESLRKDFDNSLEDIYICGGASIYKLFLPLCDKMYLTEVQKEEKDADTYFPEFDKENWERKVILISEDNGIKYNIVEYVKKGKNI